MARVSQRKLAVMAMQAATMIGSSTGCLLTGEPDFEPPDPTIPVVRAVSPPASDLRIISISPFAVQSFSVDVVSEDRADNLLNAVLLLDYGKKNVVGTEGQIQPYNRVLDTTEIPEGSLTDPDPRRVTLLWQPDALDPGESDCHVITMQVHREALNDPFWVKNCPKGDQFARVHWFVALCNATDCNTNACTQGESAYCPTIEEQQELTP